MLKDADEIGKKRGTPMGGFKSMEKISRIECMRTRRENKKLIFNFLVIKIKKTKTKVAKNMEWVKS